MIRINLLPHREEARKARRQQFFMLAGMIAILAFLIVFLVYTIIGTYISGQEEKNDFLKKEVIVLDKQIDQIKRLKEQTQALLSRKQVIESLQRDRGETVYLLSELAKRVPEGIYLKQLRQEGVRVFLSGYAQSNARIATLMRSLEASPWLENPELVVIEASASDRRRLSQFTMYVTVTRVKPEEPGKDKK